MCTCRTLPAFEVLSRNLLKMEFLLFFGMPVALVMIIDRQADVGTAHIQYDRSTLFRERCNLVADNVDQNEIPRFFFFYR